MKLNYSNEDTGNYTIDQIIWVNGLPLPTYLALLIDKGCWNCPEDLTKLKTIIKSTESQFHFCSIESMRRNLFQMQKLYVRGHGKNYGLDSSRYSGKLIADMQVLDIDNAIPLIMNIDEECVCLDYRHNLYKPVVVASTGSQWGIWRLVAPDFRSFADAIEL